MKLQWIIFFMFLISLISVNAELQERFDSNNNPIPYTIESFDDGSIYQSFGDGTINKVDDNFNLFSVYTSSNIDFLNKKCIGNPDGVIFTTPPKNKITKCLATTIVDRSRCERDGYSNPVYCAKTNTKPLNPQPKPSTNPSCTFPYSSLNECLQCKTVKEEECINGKIYIPSYSNGGCYRDKTDKSCTQITPYIEGKIYCFGNGFVDKWTNGKPVNIGGKKQCSEFGDYINDCAIDLGESTPNYGNSVDEVCKKKNQPAKNCDELNGILISSKDCSVLNLGYTVVSSSDSQSGKICCVKKIITPPVTPPTNLVCCAYLFTLECQKESECTNVVVKEGDASWEKCPSECKTTGGGDEKTTTTTLPSDTGKLSLTLTEITDSTQSALKESLCDFDIECKKREEYTSRCSGNLDIIKIVKNKLTGWNVLTEGVCFAEKEEITITEKAKDENARQKTIKKEDIQSTTYNDLQPSLCSGNDMCKTSEAKCEPLQSLIDAGFVTSAKTQNDLKGYKVNFLGVLGGAAAFDVAVGLAGASGVCAPAVALAGFGFPICVASITLGGAFITNEAGKLVGNFFDDFKKKDLTKIGYCVPKEESKGEFSLKGILTSIGNSINDLFGGSGKTKIKDTTLGVAIVGVIIFLIILRATKS